MNTQSIRVITICLFMHNHRILVASGFDAKSETYYYRPLGGGVEFGESTADALRREIQEELGQAISGIERLEVIENVFTLDGQTGHEIVYIYNAQFVDQTTYDQRTLFGEEDDGTPFSARWMALDEFDDQHRLVPEALFELLK